MNSNSTPDVQSSWISFDNSDAESLVKAGDVTHDVGLGEDVVVSEEGFIGGTIERNHVAENSAVLSLQVVKLPVHTF